MFINSGEVSPTHIYSWWHLASRCSHIDSILNRWLVATLPDTWAVLIIGESTLGSCERVQDSRLASSYACAHHHHTSSSIILIHSSTARTPARPVPTPLVLLELSLSLSLSLSQCITPFNPWTADSQLRVSYRACFRQL